MKFIVISGIDGCGKTTQSSMLVGKLSGINHHAKIVKTYGSKEKKVIGPIIKEWDDVSITLLFQALHREKAMQVQSLKQQGVIAVSERWQEAFQFHHQRYGYLSSRPTLRRGLSEMSFLDLMPDIGVMIDVPAETAISRTEARDQDMFDQQPEEYFIEMRKYFLEYAEQHDWLVVDGQAQPGVIHDKIFGYVSGLL